MTFEHASAPVLPRHKFILRLTGCVMAALGFTAVSLAAGMAGYRFFEDLSWTDCFLNAAMILGGMGEVDVLKTEGGKIFAGCFALYSGLWVVAMMGLILAPVFHRVLHRMHVEKGNFQIIAP